MTKLRGSLLALLTAGAVLVGLAAAPPPGVAESPAYAGQDLPPDMQTTIARAISGAGSAAFTFHATYQFSGASTASGQFDDGNTGGHASSCSDVAGNGDQLQNTNFPSFRVPTPQGPEFATTGPTFIVNTIQFTGSGTYKPDHGSITVASAGGLQSFDAEVDTASPSLLVNPDGSGSFAWTNALPEAFMPLVVPSGTTLSGSLNWTCS